MYLRSAVLALLVHGQIAFAAPEPPKSDLPKPPAPPTRPTEPPQAPQYEGVGRIDQITRDRGGGPVSPGSDQIPAVSSPGSKIQTRPYENLLSGSCHRQE